MFCDRIDGKEKQGKLQVNGTMENIRKETPQKRSKLLLKGFKICWKYFASFRKLY